MPVVARDFEVSNRIAYWKTGILGETKIPLSKRRERATKRATVIARVLETCAVKTQRCMRPLVHLIRKLNVSNVSHWRRCSQREPKRRGSRFSSPMKWRTKKRISGEYACELPCLTVGRILGGARNKVYFAPVIRTTRSRFTRLTIGATFDSGATCVALHICGRIEKERERENNKKKSNGMWRDRWLKEWRNKMWREREREGGREGEERTSEGDVEMRWGRGQQRGSSGNCYGDDVSGNWKVVSFVAFVCEMGAIPARRNRHTYIYRLIVVYVQLRRIHNHPSQLGEYTISRRGGVPAHRYSSCKLWIWRRRGLPSATLAASTCLESRRDFNLS